MPMLRGASSAERHSRRLPDVREIRFQRLTFLHGREHGAPDQRVPAGIGMRRVRAEVAPPELSDRQVDPLAHIGSEYGEYPRAIAFQSGPLVGPGAVRV